MVFPVWNSSPEGRKHINEYQVVFDMSFSIITWCTCQVISKGWFASKGVDSTLKVYRPVLETPPSQKNEMEALITNHVKDYLRDDTNFAGKPPTNWYLW